MWRRISWLFAFSTVVAALSGCSKSSSSSSTDGGSDGSADAGLATCTAVASAGDVGDGGSGAAGDASNGPAGVADDFGPNSKIGSSASALGQLDVYEVTTPRWLDWVDLYLRADLGGTRLTIAVYEAPARNMTFRRLTTVQVDVSPCVGWVGTGPLGIPLRAGRFYAIGFDPNQAVTTFVDSESNDLPIDGQFGRLIGSETSTSVSLDTLDWGMPSTKAFTRQRLYTLPRAADDGGVTDGAASAPPGDGGTASDATGPDTRG
jgi:hypothetical protein